MLRLGLVAPLMTVAIAIAACGGRAGPNSDHDGGPLTDGGAHDAGALDGVLGHDGAADAVAPRPDGPLAAVCTGAFARMVANGLDSHPSVTGTMLPLNCCEAAEFVVVTQTVPYTMVPIVVMWRAQVGQATVPATIDLANPPAGWGVQVDVGCDPAQGGCNPAPDSYTTGLSGTLQVARTSSGGYDMSLCLSVAESAGSPHPIVHSLELYAPHVTAAY